MENNLGHVKEEEHIDMPPGFRFHPTDEELISHYLHPKVLNSNFSALVVGDVDLNKIEPWELPWKAKMGENEWYFFCLMDRKYPTGQRTNRATPAGYWKATGKDKEIYKGKSLVGMKKTLVFYKGRAPKGEKTNWVMHEYKLEGSYSPSNLPESAKNEWIICRIFQKTASGKKIHISGLNCLNSNPCANEMIPMLPSLMDSPSNLSETRTNTAHETSHVTCFSGAMDSYTRMQQDAMIDSFLTSPTSNFSSDASHQSSLLGKSFPPEFPYSMDDVNMQHGQPMYGMLVDNNYNERNMKAEITQDGRLRADSYPVINPDNCMHSFGDQEGLSAYAGTGDFDFLEILSWK